MDTKKTVVAVLFIVGLWFAPVPAADFGAINIHGFLSQGYLKTSANNFLAKSEKGSFEFNDAGINFSTDVLDDLRLGVQLYSRDLGDAGNNKVILDWGYADYRWRNELGLRLGKVKLPFGLYNTTRDVDTLRTWAFLPQCIYSEDHRNYFGAANGGQIYGAAGLGALGSLEYQAIFGNLENADQDSTAFKNQMEKFTDLLHFVGLTTSYSALNLEAKVSGGGLIWNAPLEGLRLGATYDFLNVNYTVDPDGSSPGVDIKVRMPRTIISAEYKWKDLALAAEYMEQRYIIDPNFVQLELILANNNINLNVTRQAYYGSAAYRFAEWFELGAYYSVFYLDKHDKKGTSSMLVLSGMRDFQAWQKDTCLTARFDINSNWVCKLEGHHMNGTALVCDYGSVDELIKIWSLYAAKVSFNF